MSALPEHLASDLSIQTGTRIVKMERQDGQWKLRDENNQRLGPFDEVVITVPAPQCHTLLPERFELSVLTGEFSQVGCFTYLIRLKTHIEVPWGMAKCQHPIISKIIRENSKPGRPRDSLDRARHGRLDSERIDTPPAEARRSQKPFCAAGRTCWNRHHTGTPLALCLSPIRPQGCLSASSRGSDICGDWLRAQNIQLKMPICQAPLLLAELGQY